jgi:hypothetical protein
VKPGRHLELIVDTGGGALPDFTLNSRVVKTLELAVFGAELPLHIVIHHQKRHNQCGHTLKILNKPFFIYIGTHL